MPTIAQLLHTATQRLSPVTDTPRLDAEILLAHTLGITRAKLLARLSEVFSHASLSTDNCSLSATLESLLQRRLNHEPIAYILGQWEFFSLDFITRAPMLVPRPETEHLVEVALEHLHALKRAARVLDLCTGTGCVAITIAKHAPTATLTATDLNPGAVQLATENATLHQLSFPIFEGDLFSALPADTPPFDVITANPPYVPNAEWPTLPQTITKHEDPRALLAGDDGLDILRRIAVEARSWMNPGALLALEIGEDQFEPASQILLTQGYTPPRFKKDLAGTQRIIHTTLPT